MFIVLELLQELIILCEWLPMIWHLRRVKLSILNLLSPECNGLLLLIANIYIRNSLQLLIIWNLASFFESIRSPQLLVYILEVNISTILIVHNQLANGILIQWFRNEGLSVGCGKLSTTCLKLLLPLFLADLLSDLLEVHLFYKLLLATCLGEVVCFVLSLSVTIEEM